MHGILNEIVINKRKEMAYNKSVTPISILQKNQSFKRNTLSLVKALNTEEAFGIIAEFKRKSPSKGNINMQSDISETTKGYVNAGAAALSVLTDNLFFGGSNTDLTTVRSMVKCPILRKDFIIDEYQVVESKAIGADVILLIASILTPSEAENLARLAQSIGLEVLLEIHAKEELNRINAFIDLVGVNNRNLNDFTVSINRSMELEQFIPNNFLKISESGIDTAEKLITLKNTGYRGFLMGERFMGTEKPEKACADFIENVKSMGSTIKEHE